MTATAATAATALPARPVNPLVALDDVERSYGEPPVRACAGVSLRIMPGELVAIVGPSGSGKSTLLNLIGTLDRPTAGVARIDGLDVNELDDRSLSALRAYRVGFVFQQFHLADGVTALDNVADGLLYTGVPRAERRQRAAEALGRVGLGGRLDHHPNQLSGGERQRVALCRALLLEPPILLADEPTGNLDPASGDQIFELLIAMRERRGVTSVLVTHNPALAARCGRVLELRDGVLTQQRA
jgi:putative ABC transport system ATP-binding protein